MNDETRMTNDDAATARDEHGGHRFVDAVAGR
jgi:hypothetical protein